MCQINSSGFHSKTFLKPFGSSKQTDLYQKTQTRDTFIKAIHSIFIKFITDICKEKDVESCQKIEIFQELPFKSCPKKLYVPNLCFDFCSLSWIPMYHSSSSYIIIKSSGSRREEKC